MLKTKSIVLLFLLWVTCSTTTATALMANPRQEDKGGSAPNQARVDYWSEVRPILAAHCFECHGPEAEEGDLRLDRREYLLKGGHTGVPVYGDTVEQSGLIDRITTDDEFIRMPKLAPPLSDSDIAILTQWIQQGANYGSPELERTDEAESPFTKRVQRLNESVIRHIQPVVVLVLVYFAFVIYAERIRKRLRKNTSESTPTGLQTLVSRFGWRQHAIAMSLLGLLGCTSFFYNTRAVAFEQRDEAIEKLRLLETQIRPEPREPGQVPFIYDTGHPRRIGGVYYRGNDERSPRLFNGGYYRTATLELGLRGSADESITAGNDCREKELAIFLNIERAHLGTRALFTDSIMNSIYLSSQLPGKVDRDGDSELVYLDVVEKGEIWEGKYPISIDATSADSSTKSGTVYVYKGARKDGTRGPNDIPHYAIEYQLIFEDGRLSDESSLRMGSVYHSGNIVFTPAGKIPVSRWFDFQPIPEKEPLPNQ